MDIKNTFINLTKFTYTHGKEHLLEKFLPSGFQKDHFGNYFIKIGNSSTMFTCHLDTATDKMKPVKHVFKNNFIMSDGSTILGADDKAGMTIILYMIEKNVPGLYYFFIGEEVGCIGSSNASTLDFSNYKRCISFDRRAYSSVITHQLGQRCCSENFALELCNRLEKKNLFYEPDPTGVVTDSAMFTNQIQECTNISVGYFKEHTKSEFQDILFLKKLAQAASEINWETLPTEREFGLIETVDKYGPADEEFYEESQKSKSVKMKIVIDDIEYLATIKNYKLAEEKSSIQDWVHRSGSYSGFREVEWDGKSCYLSYHNSFKEYLGEREELIHVIDKLQDISKDDLNIIKIFN